MPTYEYKCVNCQYTFEKFQGITSEKLIFCPECKHPSLVRLIGSGSGMIFKGKGFYETDFKNK